MSNIIIFDFEVFRYDSLLGAIVLSEKGQELFQTWNEVEIRHFYTTHQDDIWIGHNNFKYDDIILETIINGGSAYKTSKNIVNGTHFYKPKLKLYSYDIMCINKSPFSLKLTELIVGKNIHTTDVDFDIDRPLSDEEKKLTEDYNADDLYQTLYNYNMFYNQFKLRLDIIKEFNLDLQSSLRATGTALAAKVLGSKRNEALKYDKIWPKLYDTLQLKNEDLKQYFLNEDFRTGKSIIVNIAGADITIAAGGAHSAIKKYYTSKFLYFDVSGYYNLIMINYNLLPRTMPAESKEKYTYMYHEQLKLKKINPVKRNMYKTILLSVFGAMNNEYTDFYDPWKALLVTTTGELFICDLLEKLDGLIRVIQTNTDGIMVEPLDWNNEQKIIEIVEEWEKRTGFVIKKEHKYDLWQRDVNCYILRDDKGNLEYKGDIFKNYIIDEATYSSGNIFECKEPSIIAKGVVNYLMFDKTPEETVEEYKTDLSLFQYACKKKTYDYTSYDVFSIEKNEKNKTNLILQSSERLQGIDRAFAWNKPGVIGMVYKHKTDKKSGKVKYDKVANLPNSVFIYNYDLKDAYDKIADQIDYSYYSDRIYERIAELVEVS